MPFDQALPRAVDQALARGWTVLTANQRAARTLHRAFDARRHALGHATWQPPAILAWDTWLAELWNRLLLAGQASALLLNRTQEHALWTAVLDTDQQDAAAGSLRPIAALAELAAGAWQLVHAYHARRPLAAAAATADTRAFARWAAEFDRRAARNQILTAAELPEALRAAIAARSLAAPTGLLLVGFDAKTPAQTALLEAARTAGTAIEDRLLPEPAPAHILATADNDQEELTACARWLRAQLIADPGASLAVIVPDLEARRAAIDRTFRDLLAPELQDITASASGPYEFSLGVPLARTPLAATALDLLRWAVAPLPLERITTLLLSPHLAPAPDEHLARAEFDAFTLRQQPLLQPELALHDLLTLAERSSSAQRLPTLLRHLRSLRKLLDSRDLTAERSFADWAATFHDLLEAGGWTRSADDTSAEFQTRRKWDTALDELATLDFSGDRISFSAALDALDRIATNTLFAPESRHAPIQIMGPLESAGSTFDALWFLRAGDLTWPAMPSPHPLLAWSLQRDLGMPGADLAHEAAHARRITQRLAASAGQVVFSYASESGAEAAHQRPSPALGSLVLTPRRAADLAPAAPAIPRVALETFPDEAPIPPPPDRVLDGGATLLALQAACSFRAFAEKRLFATAPESATLGLDPRQRGTLVHQVLELFWAEVESQSQLRALPIPERDALLSRAVDDTLARTARNALQPWPRAYLATEGQRLLNLLTPWLDFEAARPEFTVIAREKELPDVAIGPLRLTIRVDRIDRTSDGGELILDYKTGAANHLDWLGDRPDAPQLPLYAVVSQSGPLAGIAFASVRAGKDASLAGYATGTDVLAKPAKLREASSLDAQVDVWRTVLTALAEEFHAGQARVSPKQYPRTCSYCEQRLLCRLNPASLQAESLEQYLDVLDPSGESGPTSAGDNG